MLWGSLAARHDGRTDLVHGRVRSIRHRRGVRLPRFPLLLHIFLSPATQRSATRAVKGSRFCHRARLSRLVRYHLNNSFRFDLRYALCSDRECLVASGGSLGRQSASSINPLASPRHSHASTAGTPMTTPSCPCPTCTTGRPYRRALDFNSLYLFRRNSFPRD